MKKQWVIETLATGDEIVNGDIVDSNSAFLSRLLCENGYLVTRHNALPDDFEILVEGIEKMSERADLCICSGGLGPTEDDLTAEVAAHCTQQKVVFHEKSFELMKARFQERGIELTENNIRSTRVPEKARVFLPEVGTAPGFSLQLGRCAFYFLPGVPKEYRFFVQRDVLPEVMKNFRSPGAVVTQLKTLNIPESHLAYRFRDFPKLFPKIRLGYRAHSPEVWLKLTADAGSLKESQKILDPALKEAESRLGEDLIGRNSEELDKTVHELLIQSGKTLAGAESCTGGKISEMLTRYSGSSQYFLGSLVTYSNHSKMDLLGVDPEILNSSGAVSENCAREMVRGVLRKFPADYAFSVTGIAGPGGGSSDKPVGLVYLGVGIRAGHSEEHWNIRVFQKQFYGDRQRIQGAATQTVLDLLRRTLLGLPTPL